MTSTSVVTVTYNNAAGLRSTLTSLAALKNQPLEILIVDGGSEDGTHYVAAEYASILPIVFISERDHGIYDAMNKGQRLARGELIHYLNAGDCVWGEPYRAPNCPSLLTVRVFDEEGNYLFEDYPKWDGYGYCHQGILFPADHAPYDAALRIAGDIELIFQTFPGGLTCLPMLKDGGVNYGLGGVSSQKQALRNREIRQVIWRRLPATRALGLTATLSLKDLLPRHLRRYLVRLHGLKGDWKKR